MPNRGRLNPRRESADAFAFADTRDPGTPGALLYLIGISRPAQFQRIAAADQTTPGALLYLTGVSKPSFPVI